MIISRTPFRISFMGGGTDLPDFYQEEEGLVVSTTINKYVHLTVNQRFDDTFRLSYSRTEIVNEISEIEHPIFRSVLSRHAGDRKGFELISMADIPAGSGLGSSSSFTVGLLHALKAYLGEFQTADELAAEACRIEIDELKEPIGKQDQYAAAFGGLRTVKFHPVGTVTSEPVICTDNTLDRLEQSVMLFFTGFSRPASSILGEQKAKTKVNLSSLRMMKDAAVRFKKILEMNASLEEAGALLHETWVMKKSLAKGISSSAIDGWYDRGLKAGAWGGKVLGAGGGGFLMFLCDPEKQEAVRRELHELRPFPIKFEKLGSRIIFVG